MRYKKLVASYVAANGGNLSDAEDLLQEAIIVLWQNVCSGKFELKSKLSTYLMAVVKNKWHVELRKRSKFSEEIPANTTDGSPSILDRVIDNEKATSIRKALEVLNAPCKDLLLLFYFEERSLRDIARILGFKDAQVAKSKKYQCKKALEAIMTKKLTAAERRIR
ncbi:MAG: RNA polymerase sigma factor [bacterium]